MSVEWKRSESVSFPSIWRRFQGTKSKRDYWIQDITDEYMDAALDIMQTHFLRDEPLCRHVASKPLEESDCQMLREMWRYALADRLGLICLTSSDDGGVSVVGLNVTYRVTENKPKRKLASERVKKVTAVFDYIYNVRNPFSELGIDAYLGALGLVVLPQYRGERIGLEILKAREALCKAVGLKASMTAFTGIESQKLAEKAGFQDFAAVDYDELERINADLRFPGIIEHTKTLRFMYILYT